MASIRIEAEDMARTNYLIESNIAASGGGLVSLYQSGGSTGSVSATFSGVSGTYDIVVAYFDENDGKSPFSMQIGANQYSWTANQSLGSGGVTSGNLVRRTLASGVSIQQGTAFNLAGTVEGTEWARIDYIEFIPVTSPLPSGDTTAPTASLSTANITTSGSTTHSFTVAYSDNTALNVSSLDSNDILVTGPNGFSQAASLVSVNSNSNGLLSSATYRINAAGGSWDAADNGTYTISMQANQVSDTSNNMVQSGSLGTFQVNVPTTPLPSSPTTVRIEAETMAATTYKVESNTVASNGQMLSLYQSGGTTGNASATFNGVSGTYNVVVAYFDENDGQSPFSMQIGANQYSWTANQNLGSGGVTTGNLVKRTVASAVSIQQGTAINLTGTAQSAEWARVDYIEFIPVQSGTITGSSAGDTLTGDDQNNIINGLGGNDTLDGANGNDTLDGGAGNNILKGGSGIDTVTYASAIGGITANLGTGKVTQKFATSLTTPLKVMALGDSNTRGKEPGVNSPYRAGYRDDLWANFKDGGFNINFVGSAAPEGPDTVTGQNGTYTFDKNHEGRGGFAIKGSGAMGEISPNITTWLNAGKPDVVMLMAGTNDFIYQNTTAETTIAELEELIDKIYTWSPNVSVFVSTIAPISPDRSYAQKAANYNNLIPSLVSNSKYQDKNLTFVDTRNVLSTSDLWDGIHLTNQGYEKQADAWYDAILKKGNGKDTLSSIENLIGSAYNDELTGNSGVNVINGGAGNDLLNGAGGNDKLTGGAGQDKFAIATGAGIDTITDFVVGQDWLGLVGSLTFNQLSIFQGTGANVNNTLINIANTGEQLAILSGVQANTITSSAFTFV